MIPRKTKRHTVAEILEGDDGEPPMDDPELAMDDYPFNLEGDGSKGKPEGSRSFSFLVYFRV